MRRLTWKAQALGQKIAPCSIFPKQFCRTALVSSRLAWSGICGGMPTSYAERYAVTEIARHLRLLSDVSAAEPIALEVTSLGRGVFEICVCCVDHPGTIACITTALAADHFDLEDLHISSYSGPGDPAAPDEPDCSVIILRVSGSEEDTADDLTEQLHDRLRSAFIHLASGNFAERKRHLPRDSIQRDHHRRCARASAWNSAAISVSINGSREAG